MGLKAENEVSPQSVKFADSPSVDAFGRLRTSQPANLFDSQLTYDLQPLQYEQVTNGSGATIAYDATNRQALMTFSSTPTGGTCYMQSYQFLRYQPGKSQRIAVTFNFIAPAASTLKFARLCDGTNGFSFENNGSVNQFTLLSGTAVGNQTVTQANWNLDTFDGNGSSNITLDITKAQILVVDFQALYTGRVRLGFNINGVDVYAHEFLNANTLVYPYMQTANLPIQVGMTCTGTVSTTMRFTCATVMSEGGVEDTHGYEFAQEGAVTAASGARTHILSIRPKTTFNGIVNRSTIIYLEVSGLAAGSSPILWELVIGQAITGTTTFNDVNTTYSSMEYNTAGTISGSPAIVIDAGYIAATNQSKTASSTSLTAKYPITLDHAGAVRALGTLSLLVTGIGGTSATRMLMEWAEVR